MIGTTSKSISRNWSSSQMPDMKDKVALITGSNSGIGYFTAKALVEKGCHVILACRTLNKAFEAKKKLQSSSPETEITCIELDLADLSNVNKVTDIISEKVNHLDLLINNAGIMHPPKTLSAQGFEIQFAVNHLSHMLLTIKLIPLLENKKESRVVTVTSGAQFFGRVGWKNLRAEDYYNKWESYANSKLANVMFALEFHKRFSRKGIFSLAAHPGIAKTNLFVAQKPNPTAFEKFSLELFSPFFQSAEMGSLPQLYAATSDKARSGEHYGPKYNFRGFPKISPTAPIAMNESEREILWVKSYEIIKEFI